MFVHAVPIKDAAGSISFLMRPETLDPRPTDCGNDGINMGIFIIDVRLKETSITQLMLKIQRKLSIENIITSI